MQQKTSNKQNGEKLDKIWQEGLGPGAKLTERRRLFCEAQVENPSMSRTDAAIAAGYKQLRAKETASKLAHDEKCNAYIAWLRKDRVSRCILSFEEVLSNLSQIAKGDAQCVKAFDRVVALKTLLDFYLKHAEQSKLPPEWVGSRGKDGSDDLNASEGNLSLLELKVKSYVDTESRILKQTEIGEK